MELFIQRVSDYIFKYFDLAKPSVCFPLKPA
jgi:hypothetical protein